MRLKEKSVEHSIQYHELYWLAGIMEGEGTFSSGTQRCGIVTLIMQLAMIDQDTVERVGSIIGCSVRKLKSNNLFYTSAYCNKAVAWMEILYPLLGERRRKQIDKHLTLHEMDKLTRNPRVRTKHTIKIRC